MENIENIRTVKRELARLEKEERLVIPEKFSVGEYIGKPE